jgi:hypothetical protein
MSTARTLACGSGHYGGRVIFSRRSRGGHRYANADAAIAAFWQWWPRIRTEVIAAIDSGGWGDVPAVLGERVRAIHPDLEWEFAKGQRARHALVVSPGGKAELRAYAVRWLDAAPPADDVFEYHAARQADPGGLRYTMRTHDAELDLAEVRVGFAVDPDLDQADVTVYHPTFPGMPEADRLQVSFLCLDWLLGEDGVERWIGRVDVGGAPPPDAQPAAQLKAAVDRLAAADHDGAWTLMSAEKDGWPVVACANLPLAAVRFPRFDTHLAVTLPYRTANPGGLPVDGSMEALRNKEDELTALVHGAGSGTLVAHESTRGVRVLHYYVDSTADAADRIRDLLGDWSEGTATALETFDPGLRNVRHLSP